ncbi:MAG: hypothetical protein QGI46_00705, partial [Planctomycetota bacterium]|nr:hypothetical protein [Planctomycetota bacterium]
PLVFLVLHGLGVRACWAVWELSVQRRMVLRILADRYGLGEIGVQALSVLTAGAVIAGGFELARVAWWAARRRAERDVALRLRVAVYFGVALVVSSVFVLSTAESFQGPFRVRHPVTAELVLAGAYLGYVLWTWFLPAARRGLPEGLRRLAERLCLCGVVGVAFGELSLRFVAAVRPTPILITRDTPSQIRRESERQRPGALRFHFPMNTTGHYDGEFAAAGEARRPLVVSIGDSFSYGSVPHHYHFTTVAERASGLEIYNLGFPGIGPADYLELLVSEALELEPDLIVIQLYLGNDIVTSPAPPGPPRWHDADAYLLPIVWHRMNILRRLEISRTFLAAVESSGVSLTRRFPWLEDPLVERPTMGADLFHQLEARIAWAICIDHRGAHGRFFAELDAILAAAGSTPVAFVLIPDELQVEEGLWETVQGMNEQPLERDLAQRKTVEWMGSRRLPHLDLLPLLRAVEPLADGRRHVYHLRDTHFNARGNAVAGEALAAFVARLLGDGGAGASEAVAPPAPGAEGSAADHPAGSAEPALPLRLEFGSGGERPFLLHGWAQAENMGGRSFVWSLGARSALEVSLPPEGALRMTFAAAPYEFPGRPAQVVGVFVDGTEIGAVRLGKGLGTYSLDVPAAARGASPCRVELRYAYTRAPADFMEGALDRRQLAVAWFSLEFARAAE